VPDFTLSTMRSAIDSTAFPPGANTTTQTNLINKVREIFYYTPEMDEQVVWKGTEVALALKVYINPNGSHVLTLPRGVETLVGISTANSPAIIQNQWFTYLRSSPRAGWAWGSGRVIRDLGDGFCGVVDLPDAGSKLQIQTTTTEGAGETFYISGTDVNGNPISETVGIPTISGGIATSLLTYYTVLQVVKSITVGNLLVNTSTGALSFFALYQPGETVPNYRRYLFDNVQNCPMVSAICKRRYELLVANNDPCEISSVMAFESGLRGYGWFQRNDMDAYRDAIKEAINYLNAELSRYQSDTESGAVGMIRQVSAGSMRNLY
jgi:hypothetical protein